MIIFPLELFGQFLQGVVLDAQTKEPLEYVGVGVLNTRMGASTDERGYFKFEVREHDPSSIVRISMIGYEAQRFSIRELLNNDQNILLNETSYDIKEVTITPSEERTIGAKGFSRFAGWSGWSGMHVRKGYEIGIRLELGDKPVKIKNLNVLLHRQAFDTSYYRLHIRTMKDTLILDELLNENIMIPLTNESGWAQINLESYNLIMSGDIALTLEWLNVQGVNTDREMKINDRKQSAYILFKNQKKHTGLYRWGTEAKWNINKENSPSIYLRIFD